MSDSKEQQQPHTHTDNSSSSQTSVSDTLTSTNGSTSSATTSTSSSAAAASAAAETESSTLSASSISSINSKDSLSAVHDEFGDVVCDESKESVEHLEYVSRVLSKIGGREQRCSYVDGYHSQPVYACLDCFPHREVALCLGCALVCHSDHNIEELWMKRHIACDCGNTRAVHCATKQIARCELLPLKSATNPQNVYNHNYFGRYCHCDKSYDRGVETLIQCCLCEDWFHDDNNHQCIQLQQPCKTIDLRKSQNNGKKDDMQEDEAPHAEEKQEDKVNGTQTAGDEEMKGGEDEKLEEGEEEDDDFFVCRNCANSQAFGFLRPYFEKFAERFDSKLAAETQTENDSQMLTSSKADSHVGSKRSHATMQDTDTHADTHTSQQAPSQSGIPTSSSSAEKELEDSMWRCKCDYLNENSNTHCALCEEARPIDNAQERQRKRIRMLLQARAAAVSSAAKAAITQSTLSRTAPVSSASASASSSPSSTSSSSAASSSGVDTPMYEQSLSVMREFLRSRGVDYSDCVEKADVVQRVKDALRKNGDVLTAASASDSSDVKCSRPSVDYPQIVFPDLRLQADWMQRLCICPACREDYAKHGALWLVEQMNPADDAAAAVIDGLQGALDNQTNDEKDGNETFPSSSATSSSSSSSFSSAMNFFDSHGNFDSSALISHMLGRVPAPLAIEVQGRLSLFVSFVKQGFDRLSDEHGRSGSSEPLVINSEMVQAVFENAKRETAEKYEALREQHTYT